MAPKTLRASCASALDKRRTIDDDEYRHVGPKTGAGKL